MKVLVAEEGERSRIEDVELRRAGATVVVRLGLRDTLLEAVARERPDVIIVDMARPDRDSLDDVRSIAATAPSPVVMFVDDDDISFMEAAIEAGVSSYNVVGAALPAIKPIVAAAVAMFRRHRQVEAELHSAKATLAERALIARAKSQLMRDRSLTEPEAYKWLRRKAMDRGRRIAEVAAEVMGAAGAEAGTENDRG